MRGFRICGKFRSNRAISGGIFSAANRIPSVARLNRSDAPPGASPARTGSSDSRLGGSDFRSSLPDNCPNFANARPSSSDTHPSSPDACPSRSDAPKTFINPCFSAFLGSAAAPAAVRRALASNAASDGASLAARGARALPIFSSFTRPSDTLSHRLGEGRGEGQPSTNP